MLILCRHHYRQFAVLAQLSNSLRLEHFQISCNFRIKAYIRRKTWARYEFLLLPNSLMIIDKFYSLSTMVIMLPWSLLLCCYCVPLGKTGRAETESIPFNFYRVCLFIPCLAHLESLDSWLCTIPLILPLSLELIAALS